MMHIVDLIIHTPCSATSLPTTLKFKIYQAGLFRQDKCIQEFEATVELINDSRE